MTILKVNNFEDHRNVRVGPGTTVKIEIEGTEVYSHVVNSGKDANIAFQLQEIEPTPEVPEPTPEVPE